MLFDVATLMLETGMRPEEAYRIQAENVYLVEGYLVIPNGKTKAARERVPLTAVARRVLAQRMASCSGYLFPCEADCNRPVPKVNNAHDRAVRGSKIPAFRLYDLRHTWATRAAMSAIDLVTLAAMLGHSGFRWCFVTLTPLKNISIRRWRSLSVSSVNRGLLMRNAWRRKPPKRFSGQWHMEARKAQHSLHNKTPSVLEDFYLVEDVEARVGIEPTHKGFADTFRQLRSVYQLASYCVFAGCFSAALCTLMHVDG